MSEIKPEVEYVIKTGRQVVEKKQVDSPEKLNADLDNTKQLYNELGAQASQFFMRANVFDFRLIEIYLYSCYDLSQMIFWWFKFVFRCIMTAYEMLEFLLQNVSDILVDWWL